MKKRIEKDEAIEALQKLANKLIVEKRCKPELAELFIEALRCVPAAPEHVIANIEVDTERLFERIKEDYRIEDMWFSCSKQLPELNNHLEEKFIGEWDNSDPVLVYHKDDRFESSRLIARYSNGFGSPGGNSFGWIEVESCDEIENVIAWRPLPNEPEEEDEE